ncbi:dipeptidyl aminopeptidase/acylaminoacyl peptidase [Luteibacter rhizovicinus]|uniref:Dipeptidyl aminopeptidase/acylaminoacyl peptidase n=1 Tax=Luteibacter rhizovicinus TaxID=242606 RepID=A0A4R3YVS3_9GAMM|nr:S9 family peptidase [Luteibacter rhizovicinus]TCV95918.1 dipeptidyl aminopeptidase/acylaminoacyl peptidase [Luteibacter rhizovicinus]
MSTILNTRLAGALLLGLVSAGAAAQTLTANDYKHAESFLGNIAGPLVDHAVGRVTWTDDTHFWYRDHDQNGDRFLRVDAATGQVTPAFDQDKLATALSTALGKKVEANKLPVSAYTVREDGRYDVTARRKHFVCDADFAACAEPAAKKGADGKPLAKEPGLASPDGKQEAFIRDWNLWVRDIATGAETQLTTDGVANYGYATDNAGWKHTDEAIGVWSPDSKKIATFQQDQRKTGEMTLVGTNVGHPTVDTWKYPLPGDKDVTMIERVVIDVPSHKTVRFQMPPDQHRSTLCDDVSCSPGEWDDVRWAADGRSIAFVSTSRDHKQEWFRVANPETGAVREVFGEKAKTYFESGNGKVNWQYVPETDEVIWFSERSNWGQLYMYDLKTGKLKHQITSGDGNVTEVLRIDPKSKTIWFRGVGKEKGRNPYYQQFYKIGFDGKGLTLLTPEDADHTVELSKDGTYFVDSYSTIDNPPVTVLRRSDTGATVKEVARADISRLKAAGWVPPTAFTVKARDGKTDLYGLMFKPTHFDPSKKYPIVDYIYPGPQTGSVRTRSFIPAHGDNQALAELGFIVIAIDGMGTPWRTKAFHDAYFQNIGDNTLPDQVAGLRELGKRYSWIDMDKVGIWGHSGGGNATATAMFRYPDLFKVGISESGNHDNRNYEDDWAEKWQGLLEKKADGTSNYDDQANQAHAAGLKGHLLLAHGTMDDNVPPYETLLVVDALIKANKDFDLIMIPNAHHGYGEATQYMTRRRWDYFVRNLQGGTPPKEYQMAPMTPPGG